ncbi:MAG TPA: ATP phosphoribosyltransferase [Caulobacteraceae bacterium]
MSEPLIIAVPSKGRLQDQVEAWLADCGLSLIASGGTRGYLARIDGFDDMQVRRVSAADIAAAFFGGDIHLGVTGEDLLHEAGETLEGNVLPVMAMGFGRADLVVAAPKSWIDVETMADLDDVARLFLARTGRRLRVATKYRSQTRSFFALHGLADYRIADSAGATEGAPAAGAAELVVDITSSGATLAANGLRPISDGVILRSQAQLAASLKAVWTSPQLATARRLLRILEARAKGKAHLALAWPTEQDATACRVIAPFAGLGDRPVAPRVLVPLSALFTAMEALAAANVGPVTVERPTYVFEAVSAGADRLAEALNLTADSRPRKRRPPNQVR